MKELVIFIPSIEFGGVEKNLSHISNFLAKKYKQIILISAAKPKNKIFSKNIKILAPKSNFFKNKSRLIKSFICTFLLYKNFYNKNTLILSFQSNFFSIIISKIIKSKIIIRLNTSPEKYASDILKKIFFRKLYNLSDEIIVNSNEFKKNLFKYFKLKSNVILNPIDTKKSFKKKINYFRNFKGLKIISIGRLTHQKDQITLLKALNELKKKYRLDFKLYMIGKGYNYNLLSNFVIKNKLNKNIKLAGYKKNAFQYLKSADLLILSSRYEGLPNTLIEAQVAGIPIISSDCPSGPKEILMNGKLGELFKVGDYEDLYKKIYNYNRNKSILKKKSITAKKYLYRFDYKTNLNKYLKIIKKYN